MTSTRVTVVGAGVVGLSIAHDLAVDGHDVTAVADADTDDTVSAVAAALWFPHETERSDTATVLLERSYRRFSELARDAATGVLLRAGSVVERRAGVDRTWTRMAGDARELGAGELPPGAVSGVRATLPVIVTPTYLAWLRARAAELGARFERRLVESVTDVSEDSDVVVVAAGIRGGDLLGDDTSVYPIRGQVVRVANPGLTDWLLDDDNPGGITYVLPRVDDVVVGGTGNVHSWDTDVDGDTEAAMLRRATALVPALAGQPILSRAVGLRPARPTIRLERLDRPGVPIIAAYGHGGAGVTLSWGTAERVAHLVREATGRG